MNSVTSLGYDVCDLNLIYNKQTGYSYSLPKEVLEGFLHGKAFDNPNFYSPDELARLKEDINDIFKDIMTANPVKSNLAVITAGSPGCGKTYLLKQNLKAQSDKGSKFAYVCPDDVCLQGQKKTYLKDNSYTKWRPGSNAATHLLLANLIREKYGFYFGTTCSSPQTYKFFEFLKKQGYRIKILHVSASDKVRWGSIQERDKTFIQTTKKDVCEKGSMVPQRINDTFLKYADEIEFYYRGEVSQDAILAAKWIKNNDESKFTGTLQIINPEAYAEVKVVHNFAIDALQKSDLIWETAVEAVSKNI